jgi:hypothetical protein
VKLVRNTTLLAIAAALLALAGCGRPGVPTLPRGVSDRYPGSYPAGAPPQVENILKEPLPKDAH